MTTIETLLATAQSRDDHWASYERVALRSLVPFLGSVAFDRLDSHACGYRFTEEPQTPAIRRERYFVWLCEAIAWTIGELRAGRTRNARRGQLQIAKYHGYVEAYRDCLGPDDGNKCWIHASLADAITAVSAALDVADHICADCQVVDGETYCPNIDARGEHRRVAP